MLPRNEQETIISYDYGKNEWHYYSDVPKHNRKWRNVLKDITREEYEGDNLTVLEGTIDGSVSMRKRREMSEEQRKLASERLKKAREKR